MAQTKDSCGILKHCDHCKEIKERKAKESICTHRIVLMQQQCCYKNPRPQVQIHHAELKKPTCFRVTKIILDYLFT